MKRIIYNNKMYKYDDTSNLSLLDFLIEHKEAVNFNCKDGFCGVCCCKLKKGSVYEKESIAFKNDDEILMCCSFPISDIEISTFKSKNKC